MPSSTVFTRHFDRFPLPGSASPFVLDRIKICGIDLPLAGPIVAGRELDIEKRKEPGSDYSSYISHGIDSPPMQISLLLFKDIWSGKDWWAAYDKIKDRIVPKGLSRRNAIPIWHPFLAYDGINQIIVTKKSAPKPVKGLIFSVDLEGFNPKTLRIGSANIQFQHYNALPDTEPKSQSVEKGNTTTTPTASSNPSTHRTPAQVNRTSATRKTS